MAGLLTSVATDADQQVDEFLAQFDDVLDAATRDSLRTWATPGDDGMPSGLISDLQEAVHRWNRDLTELTARRAAVEAEMPEFERRAASPAATDDDLRDLRTAKGSLRLLGGQIHDLTDDYWISVLERYGVLPNYTLLDDSVTLDVGVTWIDPDTNQYMGEATSYQRGSRVALTELAPGATFYAQGLAVRIDAVDLGAGESNIHTWRLCPQCGWAGITLAGEEPPIVHSCRAAGPGPSPTSASNCKWSRWLVCRQKFAATKHPSTILATNGTRNRSPSSPPRHRPRQRGPRVVRRGPRIWRGILAPHRRSLAEHGSTHVAGTHPSHRRAGIHYRVVPGVLVVRAA